MEKRSHGKLYFCNASFAHLGQDSAFTAQGPLYTRLILVNARLIPGILAKSMDSALGKIKLEY
jgi:hypothetical protein